MADDETDAPARFDRFLPQVAEHLGPLEWVEGPAAHGPNRGFAVLYFRAPGGELGSAVSNGLRFQKITAIFPLEVCCSLLAGQEEFAHRIVVQTAHMMLGSGVGLQIGSVIPGDRPFAPGGEMVGVVCAAHPYVEEGFDVVRDAEGAIELQVITLIPASAAELALAAEHGADALFSLWERQETDLADVSRCCAVSC